MGRTPTVRSDRMTVDESRSRYRVHYDSVPAMVSHLDQGFYRHGDSRDGSYSFTDTSTWQEATALALEGWEEGRKRVADMREQLAAKLGAYLPEPTIMFDTSGFEVDVASFVAGEPEHMMTYVDVEGGKRQVHIVSNMVVSGSVGTEKMLIRGAMVAALVDALESVGHRVRLTVGAWVAVDGMHQGDTLGITTTVKQEHEPLDMERLAFAGAHPSMFRRLVFAAMEAMPDDLRTKYRVPGRYSYPGRPDHLDDKGDIFIGDVVLPSTTSEALEQTLTMLRAAGVELNE
jgi:hypothetical protein